jgi:hypothetical protein
VFHATEAKPCRRPTVCIRIGESFERHILYIRHAHQPREVLRTVSQRSLHIARRDERDDGRAVELTGVKKGDQVYHLGDVSLGRPKQLPRSSVVSTGSFPRSRQPRDSCRHRLYKDRFVWIKDYFDLKIGDRKIYLCHYSFRTWNCTTVPGIFTALLTERYPISNRCYRSTSASTAGLLPGQVQRSYGKDG